MNTSLSPTTSIVVGAVVTILLIGAGIYSQSKVNAKPPKPSTDAPAATKKTGTTSSKKPSKSMDDDEDDNDSFLRGYKKTSDGKTTSYFHREVSDKDLRIIGDCTPKRIDSSSPAPASPVPVSGSAWNAAGTHEEKSFSPWAHQHMKELIACTTFSLPNHISSSGVLMVTRVLDVSGDACIVTTRGKTKYIYDFTTQIEYQLMGANNDSLSGTMTVSDISADGEAEFDVPSPLDMSGGSAKKIFDEYIKKPDSGLQLALQTTFEMFYADCRKTYR